MKNSNKQDQLTKTIDKRFDVVAETIAQNIREIRAKRKMTQEEMREHGFDYRYYQRLEAQDIVPNIKTLVKLALAFDVKVTDFFKE
jgi:transcriptional regulator with XRE-family HTH domain